MTAAKKKAHPSGPAIKLRNSAVKPACGRLRSRLYVHHRVVNDGDVNDSDGGNQFAVIESLANARHDPSCLSMAARPAWRG